MILIRKLTWQLIINQNTPGLVPSAFTSPSVSCATIDIISKKSCSLAILPFFIVTRVVPDRFNLLPEAGMPKNSPVCVPLKFQCFYMLLYQQDLLAQLQLPRPHEISYY